MLHHNLDRVWVVTKIPIPKWEDLREPFRGRQPIWLSCDFPHKDIESAKSRNPRMRFDRISTDTLRTVCKAALPTVKMLQQKEERLKSTLNRLMQEELYGILPDLMVHHSTSVSPHRRVERGLPFLIPLITGLATLAVEQLTSHLQNSRKKAIQDGLYAMEQRELLRDNFIKQFKNDFMMYGKYNVDKLDEMVHAFNNLSASQTNLEKLMKGSDNVWPEHFLTQTRGNDLFQTQLLMYLHEIEHRYINLEQDMINSAQDMLRGIAKLAKGYLPTELFPPSRLQNITSSVIKMVQKTHPDYVLALPHISQYYDMKLVTFSVDSHHSLVVTFPILIKNYHRDPLILYEIETVPVPINDLNLDANSYTKVVIDKPYIAINNDYYIQLRLQELRMCKTMQYEYYCEELFLVKHKSKHSCASSLFFDLPLNVIKENCEFEYYYNTTVPPSVLDGGDKIVLANILSEKKLICSENYNLATPLPSHDYVLVNRSILCNCEIESGMTYVLRSIGSCDGTQEDRPMLFTINMAFFNYYKDLKENVQIPKRPVSSEVEWKFPIALKSEQEQGFNLTLKPATTLRELANNWEKSPPPRISQGVKQMRKNRTLIIIGICLSIAAIALIILVVLKHAKLRTLVTGITLSEIMLKDLPTTVAMSDALILDEGYHNQPIPFECICRESWLVYLTLSLSMIWLAIYLYKLVKNLEFWRGYRFDKACSIYIILKANHYYVPVKVRSISGQPHVLHQETPFRAEQITLRKNWLWDILHITWNDTLITQADKKIVNPSDLIVPLSDKLRVRNLMSSCDVEASLRIKHGIDWFQLPLPNKIYNPIIVSEEV